MLAPAGFPADTKEIGIYYDRPVYGGTPKDSSNPDLGIYFKFNEGIVGDNNVDSLLLDYSGRINNADFIGYKPSNRSTDSAITLSEITLNSEEPDPIVYSSHPLVSSERAKYEEIGKAYDLINHTALRKSLPQWVYDEDVFGANKEDSEMGILIQAISSEFDTIKALIDNVLKINSKDTEDFSTVTSEIEYDNKYLFGCADDFQSNDSGKQDNYNVADWQLSRQAFMVGDHPILEQSGYLEHFYSYIL